MAGGTCRRIPDRWHGRMKDIPMTRPSLRRRRRKHQINPKKNVIIFSLNGKLIVQNNMQVTQRHHICHSQQKFASLDGKICEVWHSVPYRGMPYPKELKSRIGPTQRARVRAWVNHSPLPSQHDVVWRDPSLAKARCARLCFLYSGAHATFPTKGKLLCPHSRNARSIRFAA